MSIQITTAKGTQFETDVVRVLRDHGHDKAHRPHTHGPQDTGDIHGIPRFAVQVKSYRDITAGIRLGLSGAQEQAIRLGVPHCVAIVKRPGKPTGQALAVMSLDDFADLVAEIEAPHQTTEHEERAA